MSYETNDFEFLLITFCDMRRCSWEATVSNFCGLEYCISAAINAGRKDTLIKTDFVISTTVNGGDPENSEDEEPVDNSMDDQANIQHNVGLDVFNICDFLDNYLHSSFKCPLTVVHISYLNICKYNIYNPLNYSHLFLNYLIVSPNCVDEARGIGVYRKL